MGKNAKVAYLSQHRTGLDEDKSILDNVTEGRSHVRIGEDGCACRLRTPLNTPVPAYRSPSRGNRPHTTFIACTRCSATFACGPMSGPVPVLAIPRAASPNMRAASTMRSSTIMRHTED